jgi:hypothetical protein
LSLLLVAKRPETPFTVGPSERFTLVVRLVVAMPVNVDDPLAVAWAALVFHSGRSRHDRPAWDAELAAYRADLARMRVRLAMVHVFEPAERRYFGIDGSVRLALAPQAVRETWSAKVRRWLSEHPGDAALLGAPRLIVSPAGDAYFSYWINATEAEAMAVKTAEVIAAKT